MSGFTLQQLQCFEAVVGEGGFQAAATRLGRSHPTVFAAIGNLEAQLGLTLFDRSGYRAKLTEVGRAFHDKTRDFLQELQALERCAARLGLGEESELRVVIGDLSPLPETLGLLRQFFGDHPATRLHLHFEALSGPRERLFDGEADLILHHIDKSDARLEFIDLLRVRLTPVAAPGFLGATKEVSAERLKSLAQCVIRDTARHSPPRDYFLIEGARQLTVSDQLMKRELIVQGMGWGHLPDYLIADDLAAGRLVALSGPGLTGGRAEIVAARRRDIAHGPVAERLWAHISERAPALQGARRPA
jgi:DNA-binding transcriptional LysR family regulator